MQPLLSTLPTNSRILENLQNPRWSLRERGIKPDPCQPVSQASCEAGGILCVKCSRNQQVPCDELRRETNYFPQSSFCGQTLTSLTAASFPSFVLLMSALLTICLLPCSQLTTLCASSTPKIRGCKGQNKNISESLGKAHSSLHSRVLKRISHSFMCWRHFINILINTNRRVTYFYSSGDIY